MKRPYQKPEIPRKVFEMKYPPSKRQTDVGAVINYMVFDEPLPIHLWPIRPKIHTSVLVNACAGSGKTTLLMWILSQIHQSNKKILLTSFANSIVNELAAYVWQFRGTTAQGLHSIGKGIIDASFGKTFVKTGNSSKTAEIVKSIPGFNPWEKDGKDKADAFRRVKMIQRIVELIKMTLTDWNDASALMQMIAQYNVDTDEFLDDVLNELPGVMKKSIAETKIIDFADMLFLPVYLDLKFPRYDIVFGDECQDYNKAQQQMILRMADFSLLVGDRFQAIYGFAGADTKSIQNIIEAFESVELPLDVNYRCPTSVIKIAQSIVGEFRGDRHTVINAWDGAKEGVYKQIQYSEFFESVKPGDFVMCRKNAPLIGPCFSLLKMGIKSSLKGKDISGAIIELFEKLCKKCQSIEDCIDTVESYREKEELTLVKRYKDNATSMLETLNNKLDTLLEFITRSPSVEGVIPTIEKMFNDRQDDGEVALGSCHYAKGLEFDRCFILEWDDFDTMYSKSSQSDSEQRRNLKYIAVTRAKKELVTVLKEPNENQKSKSGGFEVAVTEYRDQDQYIKQFGDHDTETKEEEIP